MASQSHGSPGRLLLIATLKKQKLVAGDDEIAVAMANVATVRQLAHGARLIREGAADTHLYLILAGRVSVIVHGRQVAVREAGDHVGGMTVLDPSTPRYASVIAAGSTVVAGITEHDFNLLAQEFPLLLRRLAMELVARIRRRNDVVNHPDPRAVVFSETPGWCCG